MNILALFNLTNHAVQPWLDAGHYCVSVDPQHGYTHIVGNHYKFAGTAEEYYEIWEHYRPMEFDLVIAFPVCTDLAVSGARHWESKRKRDPGFQHKAIQSALTATMFDAPYIIENPVGALSTQWQKPSMWIHPYEFGGYLPVDDVHPEYPEYIAPRDAYTKKTGLWLGQGAKLPVKKPVVPEQGYSRQHLKLGGKSIKTKNIRSATPRGLAAAIYEANKDL